MERKKIGTIFAVGRSARDPSQQLYAVSTKDEKKHGIIELQVIESDAPIEVVKESVKEVFGYAEVEVIRNES